MAMTALHESDARLAPAPAAAGPWAILNVTDESALERVAMLPAVEVLRPLIRLPHRVRRNKLSRKQRAAGVVIRLRLVPLFPRYLFVRGEWWDLLDIDGVAGVLAGTSNLPLPVPNSLVARIEAYQDADGAVPSELPVRRLLGVPAGVVVCPEREPRFCHVMSAALDKPLRVVDREILIRLVGYVCGASRGEDAA